jgi:hypothetical protein
MDAPQKAQRRLPSRKKYVPPKLKRLQLEEAEQIILRSALNGEKEAEEPLRFLNLERRLSEQP